MRNYACHHIPIIIFAISNFQYLISGYLYSNKNENFSIYIKFIYSNLL